MTILIGIMFNLISLIQLAASLAPNCPSEAALWLLFFSFEKLCICHLFLLLFCANVLQRQLYFCTRKLSSEVSDLLIIGLGKKGRTLCRPFSKVRMVLYYKQNRSTLVKYRSRIHERSISLRFLGKILRVLRFEV